MDVELSITCPSISPPPDNSTLLSIWRRPSRSPAWCESGRSVNFRLLGDSMVSIPTASAQRHERFTWVRSSVSLTATHARCNADRNGHGSRRVPSQRRRTSTLARWLPCRTVRPRINGPFLIGHRQWCVRHTAHFRGGIIEGGEVGAGSELVSPPVHEGCRGVRRTEPASRRPLQRWRAQGVVHRV